MEGPNCGIYSIQNRTSGKQYIGSSNELAGRIRRHKSFLRRGVHCNKKLQRAWSKYGEDAFNFKIVLFCSEDDLILYEQQVINAFNSVVNGYNCRPFAGRSCGYTHTEEARKNMSKAQKGRIVSEEARAKLRLAHLGRKLPQEQVEKIRQSMKGKNKQTLDDPSRLLLAEENRNRVFTEEMRRKMSLAKKGKKRGPQNPEHLARRLLSLRKTLLDRRERMTLDESQCGIS